MIKKYHARKKISFDEAIANNQMEETRVIQRPINNLIFAVFFGVVLFISLIAIARVAFLGGVNGALYQKRANANVNKEVYIPAPRGTITDRHGNVLADNKLVLSVFLNVTEMIVNGERELVAKAIKDVIGGDLSEFADSLAEVNFENDTSIKLAEDITREQTIAIRDLNIKSISIEKDYKRQYTSSAAAHVTGYVGLPKREDLADNPKLNLIESIGRAGLESYYDETLRGAPGKYTVYRDAVSQVRDSGAVIEPQTGRDIKISLDLDLQKYFYKSLISNMSLRGQKSGLGIAVDPRNGEVLALVSVPTYDSNKIVASLKSPNQPFFNRAVSGTYNPASTVKIFHGIAALKEGILNAKTQILSRGFIEFPNPYNPETPTRFVDWKPHGWVDIYSALARSSNIFFYAVGGGLPPNEAGIVNGAYDTGGLGVERLGEYWRKFGFGTKTGIDISGEKDGFIPDPEEKELRTGTAWRVGDTYNVSIGQGDLLITPLELMNALSAVANHGVSYKLHLNVENGKETGLDISDLRPQILEVEKGMEDAVYKPYGTANTMSGLPFRVAVKTGSAQVSSNTKTNALVVAYGPVFADKKKVPAPEIAVLVLIEDAKEGSLNAVPIANDVLEWYYYNRINKAI